MATKKEFEDAILQSVELFSPEEFPRIIGDFFTDGISEDEILELYKVAASAVDTDYPRHALALRTHVAQLMRTWDRHRKGTS